MSQKPTIHELGPDIITILDSIGNLNSLPIDIKRTTLVEVISVLKGLISGNTTGSGEVLSALSQLENDMGFITMDDIPPGTTMPTKVSELANDTGFVTINHNHDTLYAAKSHDHNGTYEPILNAENKRKITFGTATPTTLTEDEIYLQYE